MSSPWLRVVAVTLLALPALSCGGERDCPTCHTLVISAIGEPPSIFPPLVVETVGRDISDQVYERLANFRTDQPTTDESAFAPALARSWDRVDSLSIRFHLRDGARWQDGTPVTSDDVAWSFDVFRADEVDALAREQLSRVGEVIPEDSSTLLVRFTMAYPEQLYDATWHVRIIPAHIWRDIPTDQWEGDTSLARLVGSGPYRVTRWRRGQSLELDRVEPSDGDPRASIPRVIWRFAGDPEAAFNLVASHEADVFESLTLDMVRQMAPDTTYRLLPYPSAVYGFMGFRVADERGKPDPVLGDREVRRGLAAAINRRALALSVFGPETRVPSGPYSQLLWVGSSGNAGKAFDSLAAGRILDDAGWRPGGDGVRRRGGRRLEVAILVPSTSSTRRHIAEIIQEQWRAAGIAATITAVDFPVFQSRLAAGNFEAYIGAWLDEPSPRGLGDQWTREGWDVLNYGHYDRPVFDSLFRVALGINDPSKSRPIWKAAFDTLRADAPAVFLYAPTNVAAIADRVGNVHVDPFSWLAGLPSWTLEDRPRGGAPPHAAQADSGS